MRSDLDALMANHDLDVIYVFGGEEPNPIRNYLLGGVEAVGSVFKKRGQPPVFYTNILEKENASKSGLEVFTGYDFGLAELQKEYKRDVEAIQKAILTRIFMELGLMGRVGLVGVANVALTNWLIQTVLPSIPGIEVVADYALADLFEEAYATKDDDELQKLKQAGQLASAVVAATWDFIAQHHAAADGTVINDAGEPLTVGAVKQFIRMQNFEKGLENADGMIFAPEREGATGHGEGEELHVLKAGECVVFDFFPRSINSRYFHDMTRTWSLGHARPEVQEAYDQVMGAFNLCMDSCKAGDDGSRYQNLVNEYFESHGHKTTRSHPGTAEGYIHSLGHGLGLNIHELPAFRNHPYGPVLREGTAFTIEPGLYYPDRNFGVRVEDTVYLDKNGVLQNLTDFKYDLVLPLKG